MSMHKNIWLIYTLHLSVKYIKYIFLGSLQVYLWQGNAFGPNVECPKPGSLHQKTLTKLT